MSFDYEDKETNHLQAAADKIDSIYCGDLVWTFAGNFGAD